MIRDFCNIAAIKTYSGIAMSASDVIVSKVLRTVTISALGPHKVAVAKKAMPPKTKARPAPLSISTISEANIPTRTKLLSIRRSSL